MNVREEVSNGGTNVVGVLCDYACTVTHAEWNVQFMPPTSGLVCMFKLKLSSILVCFKCAHFFSLQSLNFSMTFLVSAGMFSAVYERHG